MTTPSRLVLIGHPVSHSLSPAFQNAALKVAGINLRYEALDVEPSRVDEILDSLAREHAAGNVTIPHKEAVHARCHRLSALAARVGAVNTFWHEDGQLVGDNTDAGGAEMMMRALLGKSIDGAEIALIGAGGSAAAIIVAAEQLGASSVRVFNRNIERAQRLASRFPATTVVAATMDDALQNATLVVNATPVGLNDTTFPVPLHALPKNAAVFDLAYSPGETAWVTAARAAGHPAADGEGMLVEQGALSFERWFGFPPDRNAMWKALH